MTPYGSERGKSPSAFPSLNQEERLYRDAYARLRQVVVGSNVAVELTVSDDVTASVIRDTFTSVIKRHDVFRSTFIPNDAMSDEERRSLVSSIGRSGIDRYDRLLSSGQCGFQSRLSTGVAIDVSVHKIGNRDPDEEIKRERCSPFNYVHAPLARAALFKGRNGQSVVLFVMSQLISDAMSGLIIGKQLCEAMNRGACSANDDTNKRLPEYSAFAAWQRRAAVVGTLLPELEYWESKWRQYPFKLELNDVPMAMPPWRTCGGMIIETEFSCIRYSSEVVARLMRRPTPTRVIHSIFILAVSCVLRLFTGKTYFAIWVEWANRKHDALDQVVGWVSNEHAVFVDLAGKGNARDRLLSVQRTLEDDAKYQSIPVSLVSARLRRSLKDGIRFVCNIYDYRTQPLSGLPSRIDRSATVTKVRRVMQTSYGADCEIGVHIFDHSIELSLAHETSLFDPVMLSQFLGAVVKEADRIIQESDLVSQSGSVSHSTNRETFVSAAEL